MKTIKENNQPATKQDLTNLELMVNKKFTSHDQRFDSVEEKLESHDKKFDSIDQRFDELIEFLNKHFSSLETRFSKLEGNQDYMLKEILSMKQESLVSAYRSTRMENWITKAAKKIDIPYKT